MYYFYDDDCSISVSVEIHSRKSEMLPASAMEYLCLEYFMATLQREC